MEKRYGICSECATPSKAKRRFGRCPSCYSRARRQGIDMGPRQSKTDYRPLAEQIAARVEIQPDGCWWWTGRIAPSNGYGVMTVGQDQHRIAHRVSYEVNVGPIPDGMQLDHRCHSADATCPAGNDCLHRRCVNPAHLEPVTARTNALRRWARSRGEALEVSA
jgi:hypothetical protein